MAKKEDIIQGPNEFEKDLAVWETHPDRARMKMEFANLVDPIKRQGLDVLLMALDTKSAENKMTFFDEPASTKYHGAKLGGLVSHVLQVYTLFDSYNRVYELKIPQESVVIATLFHDLCKWRTYCPNITTKGVYSQTKAFEVNDLAPLGHGEKSVILLSRYIRLDPVEELLIRWHMGPYDYNWKYLENSVLKQCRAVKFLYLADDLSAAAQGLEDQ